MELEDSYSNTRSALAHLLAHDRFRTAAEDKVAELLRRNRELLESPGVVEYFGDLEFTNLRKLTAAIADTDPTCPTHLDAINRFLAASRKLLESPNAIEALGALMIKAIDSAANDLDGARKDALAEFGVGHSDVEIFLKIVDVLVELYEAENWDTSEIVHPSMHMLAKMISANFAAYERTLNT
jgi:hypothetical protein